MTEQSPAQEFLALQLRFSHLPGLAPLVELALGESLALRYLADCGPACPTQLSLSLIHIFSQIVFNLHSPRS